MIELYEYCLIKPSISTKINLDRSRGAFGTLYWPHVTLKLHVHPSYSEPVRMNEHSNIIYIYITTVPTINGPGSFVWVSEQFVLYQHAELEFYIASSLQQQSVGRHVAPLWHKLIRSQPVFALTLWCCMLRGEATNTKCYSLWIDPTGARTHDLLHVRRAC